MSPGSINGSKKTNKSVGTRYGLLANVTAFIGDHARTLRESNRKHPLFQQYLVPVIQEIETNYDQAITIKELAGLVYVSPQYLTFVPTFLGQSTAQYLLNYRMTRAKELLVAQPDLPIQQAAFAVGFQDASHFTALFKRVGLTPLKFRQLYH